MASVKTMSVFPFSPFDNLASFGQVLKEFMICKNNCSYSESMFAFMAFLFAVCFLLSRFQIVDTICGKLYVTLYESSVCLSCEYPNVPSKGVSFLLIIMHQGHICALKSVNA